MKLTRGTRHNHRQIYIFDLRSEKMTEVDGSNIYRSAFLPEEEHLTEKRTILPTLRSVFVERRDQESRCCLRNRFLARAVAVAWLSLAAIIIIIS